MLDAVKKKPAETVAAKKKEVVEDLYSTTMKSAMSMVAGFGSLVGLGVVCPDPSFLTMTSTFSLALIAGY